MAPFAGNILLVGGFNPFEKYWSNWIISPSRDEIEKYWKPPPSLVPASSQPMKP